MTTLQAGVFGASGYAGLELIEILSTHPHFKLAFGTSSTFLGQNIPHSDKTYIAPDAAEKEEMDVAFLALPHGAAAKIAAKLLARNIKVFDLSADCRLDDAAVYEKWYGHPHPHPELLAAPYGLPEINRAALKGKNLIAVPGCYPTASILGVYPLLKHALTAPGSEIIIDAKSGVSGAGREPKLTNLFVEVYGNFSPYGIGRAHRHLPEIEQEMRKVNGDIGPVIFAPHLVPVDRGLMASIYVKLHSAHMSEALHALYQETYAAEGLVEVLPLGRHATFRDAARSNKAFISVQSANGNLALITSVIDNLRKGASAQAVQCANIACGFAETAGLLF